MIDRIWHHWEKWECVGMYTTQIAIDPDEAKQLYAEFLRDLPRFERAIKRVFVEWPISCEQFMTNNQINRIAWVGQASVFIDTGIPRDCRGGFYLMTDADQVAADELAERYVNNWEVQYRATSRRLRDALESQRIRERIAGRSTGRIDARGTGTFVQGRLFCVAEE